MAKDMRYFMRNNEPEIVTAPGPATFKDDEGNQIMFEIKVLTQEEIHKINENYRTHRIATDKKGNPLVQNGEVVFRTERESLKATQHILVEALQYPNLKDPELMQFYNCVDVTEMPMKVFSKADEYDQVLRTVFAALGIGGFEEDESETIDEAKN